MIIVHQQELNALVFILCKSTRNGRFYLSFFIFVNSINIKEPQNENMRLKINNKGYEQLLYNHMMMKETTISIGDKEKRIVEVYC